MLWTDRDFITPAELRSLDAEVLRVAQTQNLVLAGPHGLIRHAIDEAAIELQSTMQSPGLVCAPAEFPAAHYAALTGAEYGQSVRMAMSQVIVVDDSPHALSPLKRWVLYKTLQKIWAAATERLEGDRYEAKWGRVTRAIDEQHWPVLANSGIPMVRFPIACPAAAGEVRTGTWGAENLTVIPGTGELAGRMRIAISYTGKAYGDPDHRNNAESALSEEVQVVFPQTPSGLRVDISSLRPISQQREGTRFQSSYIPQAVTGWNIWAAAPTDKNLSLQTVRPIPIETRSYELPALTLPSAYPEHCGQWPDLSLTVQRVFMRG